MITVYNLTTNWVPVIVGDGNLSLTNIVPLGAGASLSVPAVEVGGVWYRAGMDWAGCVVYSEGVGGPGAMVLRDWSALHYGYVGFGVGLLLFSLVAVKRLIRVGVLVGVEGDRME